MDKILFNQLQFYGYHGVYSEENKLGQRFYVDLVLHLDLSQAGKSDNINDTVDYADIYKMVKNIVENECHRLIETLAERIAYTILASFGKVEEVVVRITKPDPPIPGHFNSVAVEIARKRG